MSRTKNSMSLELAKELYDYDSAAGRVTRRTTLSGNAMAGARVAGARPTHQGVTYCIKKIAWLMGNGTYPGTPVLCLDGDNDNLRPSNLFVAPSFRGASDSDLEQHHGAIRKVLSYNPESGRFTWEADLAYGAKGAFAEWEHSGGYRCISLFGKNVFAHRLAFLFQEGRMPSDEVDHKNGVRSDNRWSNLRDVDRSTNSENQTKVIGRQSKSGLLGAQWNSQKWRWHAEIKVKGRKHHLGFFDSEKEAHLAYLAAKRRMHEGCTV